MHAAVLVELESVVHVDNWPEPECGPDDVIIEISAVSLCGTDVGYWVGYRIPPSYPWVLGHEGAGTIVAVGSNVSESRIGDRVTVEPNYPCGQCDYCLMDVSSMCRDRVIVSLAVPGLLAERVAIPSQFAWSLPDGVDIIGGMLTEPFGVASTAVRRSGIAPGAGPALVVGAGGQGLLTVQTLVALGVDAAVIEPHDGRREAAYALGARAPQDGETFRFAYETSGTDSGGQTLVEHLAVLGTGTIIGVGERPIPLDNRLVVRNGLTLIGSMIYDHPGDFARVLRALESSTVEPHRVLGPRYPFAEAQRAFAEFPRAVGKTWIDLRSED